MKKFKSIIEYFTPLERIIWISSITVILSSFLLFSSEGYVSLIASLIGATSLIFCAKGNPFGQVLIIVFSTLYGIISYSCAYYGEMITYLCMTMPMAVVALISWLKNPYKDNKSQVAVKRISKKELSFGIICTAIITIIFYFILKYFNTANLAVSTLSIATSFIAVYLTAKRSPYFALAYALNDVVLIILWIIPSLTNPEYVPVVACFVTFLVNDFYSYINWKKMEKSQIK